MAEPRVLVVNAGSTSVKVGLFDSVAPTRAGEGTSALHVAWSTELNTEGIGDDRVAAIEALLRTAPLEGSATGERAGLTAVGHRIVHGADRFDGPVRIDDDVEDGIRDVAALAPLHNRAGLDGIAAARRVVGPSVPHIAVFDTTFHRTMPLAAAAYGGPFEWIGQGLRRYGFHGISHEWAAHRAAEILRRPLADLRLVTCHLGGGCSATAIDRGRSIDTTMGFTPLDGLVMSTRSGAVDPGLVLHLLRTGSTVDDVAETLERRAGLLGLSGISGDLRVVTAARDAGDTRAALAIDVFVHRVVAAVGSMVAALGGLDALVFTGGIGEHSAEVRARVSERFAFCGTALDDARNDAATGDADISGPRAGVRVLVVASREDLAIAAIAQRLAAAGRR